MIIPNIGVSGLVLILVVVLVLFGPSKLPELGKSVGRTIKEFRRSSNGLLDDGDDATALAVNETEKKPAVKSSKS